MIFVCQIAILMRFIKLFQSLLWFVSFFINLSCTKKSLLCGCHLKMLLFISRTLGYAFCLNRNFFENSFSLIRFIKFLFFNEVQDDHILLTKHESHQALFYHYAVFFVFQVNSILFNCSIEQF